MQIRKKLMPFQKPAKEKPFHAGEIYFLWEGLTSGYKILEVLETYLMNTEDEEMHLLLLAAIKGIELTRIPRLQKVLKDEGFSVPPQPASKRMQGEPGLGQEVKLSDDETILNLLSWGQAIVLNDTRAIGAVTRESVRKTFIDLVFEDIKAYENLSGLGVKRNVYPPPPPATTGKNALNMEEVGMLWSSLKLRYLSIVNLEEYLASTRDEELSKLLKRGIHEISIPQAGDMEKVLKAEGFTVPARPVRREVQAPPGKGNNIKLSDDEIIGILTTAAQIAIEHHVRGILSCMRADVKNMYKTFLSTEIEEYQKIIDLATSRHALENPPAVSSKS